MSIELVIWALAAFTAGTFFGVWIIAFCRCAQDSRNG